MPTFIDESGDTGTVASGGKPYFRLAGVWVPTHSDADSFRAKVRLIRQQLGLRQSYEFKYAETHHKPMRRHSFFSAALSQEFAFAIGSIDKTEAYWRCAESSEQHWACATELAALLRPIYCRAESGSGSLLKESIVVDDNKDQKYLTVIKRQFRGMKSPIRPESSLVGKVTFRNSSSDEMLQLVDMVCGAFGDDDPTWYDQIAARRSQ